MLVCSRRRIPQLRDLARRSINKNAAPQLKAKADSHHTLPSAKMRALVALYHQADSWVTAENLDKAIDQAFVPDTAHTALSLPSQEGVGWQDLFAAMQVKNLPRMAQLEADSAFRRLGLMHRGLPKREELMLEALYGVEVHDNEVLPGLEVVQEMEEGLARHIEEDKKAEDLLKR